MYVKCVWIIRCSPVRILNDLPDFCYMANNIFLQCIIFTSWILLHHVLSPHIHKIGALLYCLQGTHFTSLYRFLLILMPFSWISKQTSKTKTKSYWQQQNWSTWNQTPVSSMAESKLSSIQITMSNNQYNCNLLFQARKWERRYYSLQKKERSMETLM